jgi:hypothetical protein
MGVKLSVILGAAFMDAKFAALIDALPFGKNACKALFINKGSRRRVNSPVSENFQLFGEVEALECSLAA